MITAKNATSTNTQYDTYNGRKFSDYRLLLFMLYNSSTDKSIIRTTVVVPTAYWESGKQVILTAHHGTALGNLSGVTITYNSDTSVKAVLTGAGLLTGFEIIGWANIV